MPLTDIQCCGACICRAHSIAACKLPDMARPVPAKSKAVPWSTEVRMNGNPSVMFTPWPKLAYFKTGKPWSWYIANTASPSFKINGSNTVSAGYGPFTSKPSAHKKNKKIFCTSKYGENPQFGQFCKERNAIYLYPLSAL